MKTEHEKLKEICDKIGYKEKGYISYETHNGSVFIDSLEKCNLISVREIIFTQDFMDKLFMKLYDKGIKGILLELQHTHILQNLDNIVDYLYKFLKLGTK